jgi:DNA-binding NarL/FixJ family response regulator
MISIPTRVRVLLADDQTLFRIGLAGLLADDPRVDVVGQAADGLEAVALAGSLRPDVVLMDLKMPNLDGIAATERIVASHPEVRVVLLTTFETDGQIIHALKAGASGYVLKDSTIESIVSSLVAVMTGERVMASAVANRVLEMLTGITGPKDFYDGLTGRELEVLKLVAGGLANKQIAFTLKISDKTVRNHMSNLYEKLDVRDRSTAVLYAVRKGLVEV